MTSSIKQELLEKSKRKKRFTFDKGSLNDDESIDAWSSFVSGLHNTFTIQPKARPFEI